MICRHLQNILPSNLFTEMSPQNWRHLFIWSRLFYRTVCLISCPWNPMSIMSGTDDNDDDDNDNSAMDGLVIDDQYLEKKVSVMSCYGHCIAYRSFFFVQSHLSICSKHAFHSFLSYFLQREKIFLDVYTRRCL